MKTRMTHYMIITCFITLLAAVLRPPVALAQEGDDGSYGGEPEAAPWSEVLTESGAVQFENLQHVGQVTDSPEWMNVEMAGGLIDIQLEATFDQYITPSGNVVMVPDPVTLVMMSNTVTNPESEFIDDAISTYTNAFYGVQVMDPELAGATIVPDVLAAALLGDFGYLSPTHFYQAVLAGEGDAVTRLTWDSVKSLIQLSDNADFPAFAMLLFNGDCGSLPGGCSADLEAALAELSEAELAELQAGITADLSGTNEADKPPDPGGPPVCPPPSVQYGAITIASDGEADGGKIAPNYPIVIGQDPEERGVDVHASVTVPPVIYTWHEAVLVSRRSCGVSEDNSGGGCFAHPGDPGWDEEVTEDWVCRKHVEVFPDPAAFVSFTLNLAPASIAWINGHLAQVYPGAHVYRAQFAFPYGGGGVDIGGGTYFWEHTERDIPIQDPGRWSLCVRTTTAGTPVSTPRSAGRCFGEFTVELIRVSLTAP